MDIHDFSPISIKDITKGVDKGEIITNRKLGEYEQILGFNRKLLTDQTVLNFGSGGSNIGREIIGSGINTNIIDLDLTADPAVGPSGLVQLADKIKLGNVLVTSPDSNLHKILINIRRQFGGIQGRKFTQANGENLPFDSGTFDTVLGLFSTYQLPDNVKSQVFKELLRVGRNTLHIAPVMGKDFDIFNQLVEENNYEMVYSRSIQNTPIEEHINIEHPNDYLTFSEKYPFTYRVRRPKLDSPRMVKVLGIPIEALVNGNLLVMKKKNIP